MNSCVSFPNTFQGYFLGIAPIVRSIVVGVVSLNNVGKFDRHQTRPKLVPCIQIFIVYKKNSISKQP